ncbi:TetR family transcriptional regulator [Fictibacillus macauensis ZFHKF-1]|uniref:TetR family transcriptional regulator n=1 Tax=Fictibacillus macauensis ZFHKF-1 TaxID=1196324 RepID=I8UFF6_9BACL|nr:TetR/AcrR family transcriptional regulator [Fictibacillus macauensis]EIT85538.1 TetR family transcriptional regulator [Fictibacillus macauensis ZFHKF-1]
MAPKVPASHKQQRRDTILTAAKTLFAQKGYEATTIQDIMDVTKSSRGGIYAYFANKEAIFHALLATLMEEQAKWVATVYEQTNKKAWQTLLTIIHAYRPVTSEIPKLTAAITEYMYIYGRRPENSAFVSDRYQQGLALYTSLLQKGVTSGEFQPIAPLQQISSYCITFLDGIAISQLMLTTHSPSISDQLDLFILSLAQMLGKEAPDSL